MSGRTKSPNCGRYICNKICRDAVWVSARKSVRIEPSREAVKARVPYGCLVFARHERLSNSGGSHTNGFILAFNLCVLCASACKMGSRIGAEYAERKSKQAPARSPRAKTRGRKGAPTIFPTRATIFPTKTARAYPRRKEGRPTRKRWCCFRLMVLGD
jgi:hypothetical protein